MNLNNFLGEAELWYNKWKGKNVPYAERKKIELNALVKETQLFFASIKLTYTACTTCTIERSFHTLHR